MEHLPQRQYFTVYDDPGLQQRTYGKALARRMEVDGLTSKVLRVEFDDEGEPVRVRWTSAAEEAQERADTAAVTATMIADMNGEIEG